MACRCSEISKCEQDIRLLEKELAQELNSAQKNSNQGTTLLLAFGQDLTSAVYLAALTRIDTRLVVLKKNQDNLVNNCLVKRTGELTRLRSKRAAYENEDLRYHQVLEQRGAR